MRIRLILQPRFIGDAQGRRLVLRFRQFGFSLGFVSLLSASTVTST
jgi:hypothetical protein